MESEFVSRAKKETWLLDYAVLAKTNRNAWNVHGFVKLLYQTFWKASQKAFEIYSASCGAKVSQRTISNFLRKGTSAQTLANMKFALRNWLTENYQALYLCCLNKQFHNTSTGAVFREEELCAPSYQRNYGHQYARGQFVPLTVTYSSVDDLEFYWRSYVEPFARALM
jgi:hypothetical protein